MVHIQSGFAAPTQLSILVVLHEENIIAGNSIFFMVNVLGNNINNKLMVTIIMPF